MSWTWLSEAQKACGLQRCKQKADIKIHLDLIYTPVASSANVFLVHIKKKQRKKGPFSWRLELCGNPDCTGAWNILRLDYTNKWLVQSFPSWNKAAVVTRGRRFQFFLASPYPQVTSCFYRQN